MSNSFNPDSVTPGLEVIKLLAFLHLFISMVNTTSERLKARNFFICRYLVLIGS